MEGHLQVAFCIHTGEKLPKKDLRDLGFDCSLRPDAVQALQLLQIQ